MYALKSLDQNHVKGIKVYITVKFSGLSVNLCGIIVAFRCFLYLARDIPYSNMLEFAIRKDIKRSL